MYDRDIEYTMTNVPSAAYAEPSFVALLRTRQNAVIGLLRYSLLDCGHGRKDHGRTTTVVKTFRECCSWKLLDASGVVGTAVTDVTVGFHKAARRAVPRRASMPNWLTDSPWSIIFQQPEGFRRLVFARVSTFFTSSSYRARVKLINDQVVSLKPGQLLLYEKCCKCGSRNRMLGLIVASRLVQTDFQQIGETQFLITVNDADNINHIVLFLTGTIPFPEGMGGAVYFSWPDPNAPPNWQFLGYISNAKPSAIFKISNLKRNHEFANSNLGIFGVGKISHVAQIGVSVEPLSIIEQQAVTAAATAANTFVEFTQKMITSFLNYISSFSVTQSQMTSNPTENFVPLSSVQSWYETFERRLQQNPNFWKA